MRTYEISYLGAESYGMQGDQVRLYVTARDDRNQRSLSCVSRDGNMLLSHKDLIEGEIYCFHLIGVILSLPYRRYAML